MPWNGSGTFTRQYGSSGWANDKAAGTKIVASRHDTNDDDLATGINNCLTKDGQVVATAAMDFGGFKLTNVADGAALSDAATVKQVQNAAPALLAGVAGTDTITASTNPSLTAYTSGQMFKFVPAGANTTTTVNLNINGLGAKNITKKGATALLVGDIKASTEHVVIYDGTQFQLINPLAPLSAYATLDATTVAGGDLLPIYDVSATTDKAITVDNLRATVGLSRTAAVTLSTGSPASVDFTSIPSWAKRITLLLSGASLSGSANLRFQLGTGGSPETGSYIGAEGRIITGPSSAYAGTSASGFDAQDGGNARLIHGSFAVENISGNIWLARWMFFNDTGFVSYGVGSKTLAGALDMLRLTSTAADTFDAGSGALFYE